MSTDLSTTQPGLAPRTRPSSSSGADALAPQRTDVSFLSPSARTSFTRVDAVEDDEDSTGAQDELQVEQAADGALPPETEVPQTPQVSLAFLLVSGKRRTMSFNPDITVGRAKELVWNAWPNEWQDERPPAPSYLRILYLGKILQDEDTLIKVGFPTHIPNTTSGQASEETPAQPTVVHLSIRPCPPSGAKDVPKKKSMRRGGSVAEVGEEVGGQGCCSACVVC
ncbi:ubiquitin-related domain-containing protein [Phanerochaete sordida]|uniref:Ubiquitin-related domain-containing protein n=1 Tax=Phanerochaete sordida TaxID=48140 RepID=A0A9P3G1Z7_9APHY|nr:ubiquitin-related domain-containing protein [Phanerochaete sordida]